MITKAFILGAGLGTRLRPLTDVLPKPLVPVFHEPMANYALRHCQAAGIKEFAINTHHIPEAWQQAYPDGSFHGSPLSFFHEPVLLETGGGIRNISAFIGDDPILVYNGDILTDIDIGKLIAHHQASGNIATLALRSSGQNCNVNIEGDQITDMRNLLGDAQAPINSPASTASSQRSSSSSRMNKSPRSCLPSSSSSNSINSVP